MFGLSLCSPLLLPFGFKSVTRFDSAPLGAFSSQKPACDFLAQDSSLGLLPNSPHERARSPARMKIVAIYKSG